MLRKNKKGSIAGWIFVILLTLALGGAIVYVTYEFYKEITFFYKLERGCEEHPNICFCDNQGCTIKTSCTTNSTDSKCNYTEICDFAREIKWERILWDYECEEVSK
jgi:hypothetical protein